MMNYTVTPQEIKSCTWNNRTYSRSFWRSDI